MKTFYKFLFVLLPLVLLSLILKRIYFEKSPPIETSGALQSLDMWALQRAYPEKTLPDKGYFQAFEYSKMNLTSEADNSGSGWEAIGPLNIGGRTLSIAINPVNGNTIYAGSASGGLWKSYTGGVGETAWENVPTGFPVLGVSSIAISHADTNIIYIGTGEVYGYQNANGGMVDRITRGSYGIGILKTTNNGLSWTKSLDWSYDQSRGVQIVKINPLNSNVVWAGTTEGTYVSYNAGANWNLINNTIMVTDIAINHLDTGTVFIACGNLGSSGNGIYRTTNSGSNWERLTNGLPGFYGGKVLLSMYQSSPNVIFASIGFGFQNISPTQLCRSVDNGNSWITLSDFNYATYQGWYSHFVGVDPLDSGTVLVGGIDIFKSTDGGRTLSNRSFWNIGYFGRTPIGGPEGPPNYSHADHHVIVYDPFDHNKVYFGNDGGVFRSTDGGETFEACNGGYQTAQLYQGFSSAKDDSLFALGGMQDNGSGIYDGQQAWIKIIGGDGCWTGINGRNKDTIYGSYQFLNMLSSINGGAGFYTMGPSTGYSTAFVAPFILGNVNPQIIYAGRSVVFKTTNAGELWELTNGGAALDGSNPVFTMTISKTDDDVLYAATAPLFSRARLFKTVNGGQTWSDITGILPDRFISDVAIDQANENNVYCTVSGFGSSHLFKSTNGGISWIDNNNGLPDVPTSAVIVDPFNNDHIYIGNDLGVYISTTAGANWSEFQTGITDVAAVYDLSISESNRKIRAVTHGKGVFERYLQSNTVGIKNTSSVIEDFHLHQNYPNPFNPTTNIDFTIPKDGNVKLSLYDIEGKLVSTISDEFRTAGYYSVKLNATNLSSGVYYYKAEFNNGLSSAFLVKKMVVLK
ncbi:MAG: T9SS type A sorting domain-containing protein [Ignavibacteria bacterium]